MRRLTLMAVLAGTAAVVWPVPGTRLEAQLRVAPPVEDSGSGALELVLRRLGTVGTFMQATAHPDDEDNALLVMYARGNGYRTILATATRGDGGQNEIGPELFEALGVLRTEELEAMHRFDGAEQYFTRAIDFGYSFSIEETFEKWGREEIVGDYVRLIRMLRPDVIAALPPEGNGGGQHHQASSVLAREAYHLAADPTQYPGQIAEGLRPWQAKKFYIRAGFGRGRGGFGFGRGGGRGRGGPAPEPAPTPGICRMDTAAYDPLLGRTYAEIGTEARSMHKCQGMAQLLSLPGPQQSVQQLVETSIPGQMQVAETSLFDGIDTRVEGLVQYVDGEPPAQLVQGLSDAADAVRRASRQLRSDGPAAAGPPLAEGLAAVRDLRRSLAAMGLTDGARYEIDTRLALKETDFQRALLLAYGVRIETLADDGVVTAGQPVNVSVGVFVESAGDVDDSRVTVRQVGFEGLTGAPSCEVGPVEEDMYQCRASVGIPGDARMTVPYWRREEADASGAVPERYRFEPDAPFGLPFRPTPFQVTLDLEVAGSDVQVQRAVEYRYEGNIFSGEKRMDLHVVPALAVGVTPEIAIIPSTGLGGGATAASREIRVTVTNNVKGEATGEVRLALPAGWRAEPPATAVTFGREDEVRTVRFLVRTGPGARIGAYDIRAVARMGDREFDSGYQVVEYPHTRRRDLEVPAVATLKLIDVDATPDLQVGYVMGVGDQVPPAIEQLGATLTLIDSDELAWGDLSRYDVIMTGVRAYERREDLRAYNHRLIDYVEQGGTMIVQYNKFEFNQAQYGPFPVQVSNDRVTDELSPVRVLVPDHPIFTSPNLITDAAWDGWVQERGLYFLGQRAPEFVDLVELDEPFPNNAGTKRGALVEARYGQGRWVYVGLGLWRQLPAGTDGAYQLLANLISLD